MDIKTGMGQRDDQQGADDPLAGQIVEHDGGDQSHCEAQKYGQERERNIPEQNFAERFPVTFVSEEIVIVTQTR